MSSSAPVPVRHLLLALAVVFVWGTNFSVIKVALGDLPPLFFASLRFTFAFLPAVFFLPRPKVPLRELVAYGVLIGAGQFGILYIAMRDDITPGLASLVIQTQVFFTIGLAMAFSGEHVRPYQLLALGLAVAGIVLIGLRTGGETSLLGLILVLIAAFSWACGNMVSRRARNVNMLAYVVWASAFAIPPLLILSLVAEGPAEIGSGIGDAGFGTWFAVFYQSAGNTMFGYGVWSWLLSRHPAATITPAALLVPVFGFASASIFLGEPLPAWKIAAAALVMFGLGLNFIVPRFAARRSPVEPSSLPQASTPAP